MVATHKIALSAAALAMVASMPAWAGASSELQRRHYAFGSAYSAPTSFGYLNFGAKNNRGVSDWYGVGWRDKTNARAMASKCLTVPLVNWQFACSAK